MVERWGYFRWASQGNTLYGGDIWTEEVLNKLRIKPSEDMGEEYSRWNIPDGISLLQGTGWRRYGAKVRAVGKNKTVVPVDFGKGIN